MGKMRWGKEVAASQCRGQMITERTTFSHDFIYTVTTLFTQLRLYLLGTPGAQDGGVERHGDLERAIRQFRQQPLRPRFVGGRQSMPQREIELLHKTDDEDRQQTGADSPYLVLVREGVHAARGDEQSAGQQQHPGTSRTEHDSDPSSYS